jgi:hypothetical protein
MDPEKIAAVYRAYEVYPRDHKLAGRRRFKRIGISWRKGTAKTEWAAQIAYAELHPQAPVRFNGWNGTTAPWPTARPSATPTSRWWRSPPTRLRSWRSARWSSSSARARRGLLRCRPGAHPATGRQWPSRRQGCCAVRLPEPGDGARTTLQHFDETHRQELPRLIEAHTTMLGNLPKRPMEDPWSLETTTAGRPGAGSVAERTHKEAQLIADGKRKSPDIWYFHREAGPQHDLSTIEGRIKAIAEASEGVGEFGPGQFQDIAGQWERPGVDKAYLERVWLNRWTQADLQAFDVQKFEALGGKPKIKPGSFVTAGFDGARFKDATGFVITDIVTGVQMPWALWERPAGVEDWEVPIDEVNQSCAEMFETFDVWQLYADPPHYVETVAQWANMHPDHVTEWWTNQRRPMGKAARAYREAIDTGVVGHPTPSWATTRPDPAHRQLRQGRDQPARRGRPEGVDPRQVPRPGAPEDRPGHGGRLVVACPVGCAGQERAAQPGQFVIPYRIR